MTLTDGDLELVDNGSNGNQRVALHFENGRIPPGADVIDARVQFTVDETHDEPTLLELYLDATPASALLTTTNFDVSNRARADWATLDPGSQDRGRPRGRSRTHGVFRSRAE